MSGHYYTRDGKPMHFVPKKDGKGTRPTTVADAKELDLVPGVSTLLKLIASPPLVRYLMRQAAEAALTCERDKEETLPDYLDRIVDQESARDSDQAKTLGQDIHKGVELCLTGNPAGVREEILPWIMPAVELVHSFGTVKHTELVVVGDGYGGRCDLVMEMQAGLEIMDFKSARKMPKTEAWKEHQLQGCAYAQAYEAGHEEKIAHTSNLYISTVEKGKFLYVPHFDPWQDTYKNGFRPLVELWQWMHGFRK